MISTPLRLLLVAMGMLGVHAQENVTSLVNCDHCLRILYQTAQQGKHYIYYHRSGLGWTAYPGVAMSPSVLGGDFDQANGWFEFKLRSEDVPSIYSEWSSNDAFTFVFTTDNNGTVSWDYPWLLPRYQINSNTGTYYVQNLQFSPLQLKQSYHNYNNPDAKILIGYMAAPTPIVYFRTCDGEWPKGDGVPMVKEHLTKVSWELDHYHLEFNSSCVELAFHDDKGHWDSNNGKNYKIDKPGVWNFYNWLPRM